MGVSVRRETKACWVVTTGRIVNAADLQLILDRVSVGLHSDAQLMLIRLMSELPAPTAAEIRRAKRWEKDNPPKFSRKLME